MNPGKAVANLRAESSKNGLKESATEPILYDPIEARKRSPLRRGEGE